MKYNHSTSHFDMPKGVSKGLWEVVFKGTETIDQEVYSIKVLGYSLNNVLEKINLGEDESILEVRYLFDIDVFIKPGEVKG